MKHYPLVVWRAKYEMRIQQMCAQIYYALVVEARDQGLMLTINTRDFMADMGSFLHRHSSNARCLRR